VLLDCNALLLPFRERFPLDAAIASVAPEARVAVTESVLGELERLADAGTAGARPALQRARKLPGVPSAGTGDAGLLRTAVRERAWVLTGDVGLLRRLRAAGVPTLRPRGRASLAYDPGAPTPVRRRATVISGPPLSRRRKGDSAP
jgi:rRNA-processing protein FCF1